MQPVPRDIVEYIDAQDVNPYRKWITELRDKKGAGKVDARLIRISGGNLGDCEPVGDGVYEVRIDFGPGYRVYFGQDENKVVLLGGGDKSTQVSDIARAKKRWEDYNA